jgi:hypothetical protein
MAGGTAGGLATDAGFTIARVALAARGNLLELFVASEVGPDGGAALAWARRVADGGWTAFSPRPEVTSSPQSLDLAAWNANRFDLIFQGTCGAGSNRLCQQFWENELFSPVYDLGVAPDAGVPPNGPFLPAALVAPASERLAAYGFYFTPGGRRLARTAYTGVLPWQAYESPAMQPGFTGFFDGLGRTNTQGQETTVLVGRVAGTTSGLRVLRYEGPTAGGGAFLPFSDLPVAPIAAQRSDGSPALAKSLLSATNWVVIYDVSSTGLLYRLQGNGAASWDSWRLIEPAPATWKSEVSPACTNTPSREVCAVVRRQTNTVWLVESQELGDGGLNVTFSEVGTP